ncbi:hypothetical protein [Stenotrophomonas sp. NPDC077659]|uniref:hypothetical protein n=1 Tax=Stenotrophomonas sp. NPDC077659 TaxID=3390694 RepID=UPI003D06C616
MGYIINFPTVGIVADDISSFELHQKHNRVDVQLKTGKEHSFAYETLDDAKKAYNSLKAGMAHAGFDGTYIG